MSRKALVTMEERKEFWRYQKYQKWFRKHVGEHWIDKVLEAEEKQRGIESRNKLGAYFLKMHQIELRIWMETHRSKPDAECGT